MSRVKNKFVLKFVKKFQPNPAQTRGEPGWLAGFRPILTSLIYKFIIYKESVIILNKEYIK